MFVQTVSAKLVTCATVRFRFLSLLQQIVKEPSAAFKVFVPRIIDLCMSEIYPIVAEVSLCKFVKNEAGRHWSPAVFGKC